MPRHREQKPANPIQLTRTERKAADIDSSVKQELEKSRSDDMKKIARLKALRMAQDSGDEAEAGEPPAAPTRKS